MGIMKRIIKGLLNIIMITGLILVIVPGLIVLWLIPSRPDKAIRSWKVYREL